MKYVQDDDGEYIGTEEVSLDGEPITVRNSEGFGGCDIQIEGGTMTWAQLDKLKVAISMAENRWRHVNRGVGR